MKNFIQGIVIAFIGGLLLFLVTDLLFPNVVPAPFVIQVMPEPPVTPAQESTAAPTMQTPAITPSSPESTETITPTPTPTPPTPTPTPISTDPGTYGTYSLTVSPNTVPQGGNVTVNWTAPADHSGKDWISLYKAEDPNRTYQIYEYVPEATSGSLTFTIPPTATAGRYEFRYLLSRWREIRNEARVLWRTIIPSCFDHAA